MAINPRCDSCSEELADFGGILLGPPNDENLAEKLHLCKPCYEGVRDGLKR